MTIGVVDVTCICGPCLPARRRDNDVDVGVNEIAGKRHEILDPAGRRGAIDNEVAALDVVQLAHRLEKGSQKLGPVEFGAPILRSPTRYTLPAGCAPAASGPGRVAPREVTRKRRRSMPARGGLAPVHVNLAAGPLGAALGPAVRPT